MQTSAVPAPPKPSVAEVTASFTRMCLVLDGRPPDADHIETGHMFLSMSPAFQSSQTTRHGRSIGLDDDTAYLTRWVQGLLTPCLVVPAWIQRLYDPARLRYALAVLLLAAGSWKSSRSGTRLSWKISQVHTRQRRSAGASAPDRAPHLWTGRASVQAALAATGRAVAAAHDSLDAGARRASSSSHAGPARMPGSRPSGYATAWWCHAGQGPAGHRRPRSRCQWAPGCRLCTAGFRSLLRVL